MMPEEHRFSTPVDMLEKWAEEKPDDTALIFLEQGEYETDRLTFSELDREARNVAALLQSFSEPGERVLLVYPTGLNFVKALFGCLYAGVIPIPTNPPGRNRSVRRLDAIAKDAQASLALTTSNFLEFYSQREESAPELKKLRWVEDTELATVHGAAWRKPNLDDKSLAFIQYTSGSTNLPKGVMVSYGNLSYNRDAIHEVRKRETGEESVIITWCPLFHDMGLIFGIFQGIFDGQMDVLMTPISFIQKPVRWLNAITRYRGTFTGGPNFSYDVCVSKITLQDCENLDLSSWRMAYNGAEPIRPSTHKIFAEKFGPYGFNPEAFHPCYGLAESTLIVSGYGGVKQSKTFTADRSELEKGRIIQGDGTDPAKNQELVSCGPPLVSTKAAVVDPKTRRRSKPNEVGEIWVSGGNVAEGYWNRSEETQETFKARIADSGEGPFLRTGDLGFLHKGEIYITGREKDLIIIRGRNYYPQDIEYTVQESHPGLRPGCGAAFSILVDGVEHLVLVQEVRPNEQGEDTWDAIIKKIRFDVAREHGIRAYSVVLINPSRIPKTSSGKIQRAESRKLYLNGEFESVSQWRAPFDG